MANTKPVAIDYSQILFDGQGKPYWRKVDGSKTYLPPLVAMQSSNPRAVEWARSMGVYTEPNGTIVNRSAPGSSYLRERGHWDLENGEWDQDINWNNLMATAVGAQIAAPYVVGAMTANSAAAPSVNGVTTSLPGTVASQGASHAVSAGANGMGWSQIIRDYIIPGVQTAGDYVGTRAALNASREEAEIVDRRERERMAEDKRRYDQEYGREGERFDAREGRLAPFRAMGGQALPALQRRLGLDGDGSQMPPSMYVRMSGFGRRPGDPLAPSPAGPSGPGAGRQEAPPPTSSHPGGPVRDEQSPPYLDPNMVPASAYGQPQPPMTMEEWLARGGARGYSGRA